MGEIKLASRMATMKESATLALNARAKQLAAEGKTIHNLTAGELATDTPDYIQAAVAQKLQHNKYTPVAGLMELREAIAQHSREFYGLGWIKAENVVVTAGAKPAIAASLVALLDADDEVIVPTPAWTVSYKPLIELAGGHMVEVPLTAELDLDVQAIEAAITTKTKAIIVNSPNNPTGTVYSTAAVGQLAQALQNKNITVIADDIYTKLVFDEGFSAVPTAGFENLIIINGLSKSQALTGWRIGYLIATTAVAEATTSLLSHITGNAPLPSQYAGLAAMERNDQPPTSTLDDLRRKRLLVSAGLTDAGINFQMPGGAFYFLLDLRDFTDDGAKWCEELLVDAGVALVPGDAFGAPGYARLTFVADDSTLQSALSQIKKFVKGTS